MAERKADRGPDFERLAWIPWPSESLASSGMRPLPWARKAINALRLIHEGSGAQA
jgi:hypothetical protein